MKAIDLYSGIGGWALGLKLAGIEVVRSYEWWTAANDTYSRNFGALTQDTDIRTLPLADLPTVGSVDVVVGSPPCTQFSYSNRGGSGDLVDGLVDVRRMLAIVEHLRPKYWVMENVPRVSRILEQELAPFGSLHEYAHLVTVNEVVNMADYGLPQSRKRMLAGNFPVQLLRSYRGQFQRLSLGDVVSALQADLVVDPLFGHRLSSAELSDHLVEEPLTPEEERMNREAKTYHPVYNRMSFPDRLDRPARTVTATCTRVSRESVVVKDPASGLLRRLTLRERASLQGFPITFQFFGKTYAERTKMIGNAIPPFFTYLVAMAMSEVPPAALPHPSKAPRQHFSVGGTSKSVPPDSIRTRYPESRTFRAALPGLRFGSGVRFQLENGRFGERASWSAEFYYGTSKRIHRADLSIDVVSGVLRSRGLGHLLADAGREAMVEVLGFIRACPPDQLQERWTRRAAGPGPYELVDQLGDAVRRLQDLTKPFAGSAGQEAAVALFPGLNARLQGDDLGRVVHGAAICSLFNAAYSSRSAVDTDSLFQPSHASSAFSRETLVPT